jgi:hypothetical protein
MLSQIVTESIFYHWALWSLLHSRRWSLLDVAQRAPNRWHVAGNLWRFWFCLHIRRNQGNERQCSPSWGPLVRLSAETRLPCKFIDRDVGFTKNSPISGDISILSHLLSSQRLFTTSNWKQVFLASFETIQSCSLVVLTMVLADAASFDVLTWCHVNRKGCKSNYIVSQGS